ncbi:MAG: helix-turn-helix domain-containing protein [Ruminococcaceae bacterium]|nr:helix-turn-helix domain-containing protein [Oscillospiraceae bacterium]
MEYIFHPTILESRYYVVPNRFVSPARIVKDYEFDFYIDGEREMWIDDVYYTINAGSLIIRTPGQKAYSRGDYNCYMLTLDFSNRFLPNYSRNKSLEIQPLYDSPIWKMLPTVFKPAHSDDYIRIFKSLATINMPDINDHPHAIALVNELLHLIVADSYYYHTPQINFSKDDIDKVCNYIKFHYSENITLDELADIAHINKNYLIRKFKKQFNLSPISYLIQYRLDMAKKLLSKTDLPIKTIVFQCGFNDYSYFCFLFKKTFSITPAQYRASKIMTE